MVFDVDGVVTRGSDPLDAAKRMFKRLAAGGRKLKVPLAFVTNGTGYQNEKAATLSKWFDIDVRNSNSPSHPTPASPPVRSRTRPGLVPVTSSS